jgi:hypothetical protein
MPITFRYKDKQYTTNNLSSKLTKLDINAEDIVILSRKDLGEVNTDIKKYIFYNYNTKESIVSIYEKLEHLKDVVNDIDGFILKDIVN